MSKLSKTRDKSIKLGLALLITISFTSSKTVLIANSGAQELPVAASFEIKEPVAPRDRIEIKLTRQPTSAEGRIALLIGETDVSALVSSTGDKLVYTPSALPLPVGENRVTVFLVSQENDWKEIARFTLRVKEAEHPRSPDAAQTSDGLPPQTSQSGNGGARRWGFDKAAMTPLLTIGLKSQAAESHFPDSNRPPRSTFADTTLQGSLRSDLARGVFNSQSQFDVVGSSFIQEALRFSQEGDDAPRIDMSSYLLQFQAGKLRFNAGHIAFGSNRHLINSFSSRGLSVSAPITNRSDLSLAAMNGTSIVGWDNFFGLSRRKHQIVAGTVGFEFLPERPGGLRLETSLLDGRLLPVSSFNQGSITDAERSRGVGLRFLASDPLSKWRLEGGFTRSGFINPADPLLYQGRDVVRVRGVSRNAQYLEAGFNVLQNFSLGDTKKANLAVNYRHERVDPLFRSIAAFTQADRLQNQLEAAVSVGEVTANFSRLWFSDNLRNIPSILKSLNRSTNLIVGVPVNAVAGNPARPSPWLPRLSYTFNGLHQFAASIPVNGGFEVNPSTIPDQVSTNQNINAEWQWGRSRFGYRFNRSFQDNRQRGRELADFRNLVNGFAFTTAPAAALDLGVDVSLESALNREMQRIDTTLRIGSNINWRITQSMALAALVSGTAAGATGGAVENRSSEIDLQWSYRWGIEKSRFRKTQAQIFVRYANRYSRNLDNLFGFNNLTKLQTLNAGLSFTFF